MFKQEIFRGIHVYSLVVDFYFKLWQTIHSVFKNTLFTIPDCIFFLCVMKTVNIYWKLPQLKEISTRMRFHFRFSDVIKSGFNKILRYIIYIKKERFLFVNVGKSKSVVMNEESFVKLKLLALHRFFLIDF